MTAETENHIEYLRDRAAVYDQMAQAPGLSDDQSHIYRQQAHDLRKRAQQIQQNEAQQQDQHGINT